MAQGRVAEQLVPPGAAQSSTVGQQQGLRMPATVTPGTAEQGGQQTVGLPRPHLSDAGPSGTGDAPAQAAAAGRFGCKKIASENCFRIVHELREVLLPESHLNCQIFICPRKLFLSAPKNLAGQNRHRIIRLKIFEY